MNWIDNAVFYHIYPLGFCGALFAERDEVNRIRKIADWIPHMKELGVNAVYLGPVFESADHGYDTSDYRVIDRRLGTNADFREVCRQLHEAGIRIVLDGVFNHVGRGFLGFLDVRHNGAGSRYAGWFKNMNFGWGNAMGDNFSYEGWNGHLNLVKLNVQNPEVADYLIDSVKMWIEEFGIDGLRLDAADCVDDNFWKRLRWETKNIRSDFWLMGEIIHGNYARWANNEMLDSVTNYECYKGIYSSHNDKNFFEIAHSIRRQKDIYKGINLYNFVDNHDVNRIASVVRRPEYLYTIYTLLICMKGIPSIYYGSEWGIKGEKTNNSDLPMRPCLEPGKIEGADDKLRRHISKLCKLRTSMPALYKGEYDEVYLRNEQYVFRRTGDGQAVYVCLNLADHPAEISFTSNCNALRDVLNEKNYTAGNVRIEMPPFSSMLLLETNGEYWDTPEVAEDTTVSKFVTGEVSFAPYTAPAPAAEDKELEEVWEAVDAEEDTPEAAVAAAIEETAEDIAVTEEDIADLEALDGATAEDTAEPMTLEETVSEPVEENAPAPEKKPRMIVTEVIDHRRYRHYKGGMYEVVAVAKHTDTGEEFVVYRDLYDWSKAWARPKDEFCEAIELDGRMIPRFTMM